MIRPLRPRVTAVGLLFAVTIPGCGGSPPTGPDGGDGDAGLPAVPVLVMPAAGAQLTTDTPTFTVQNARGYNTPASSYTFHLLTRSGAKEIAAVTVTAGRGTTSATFATPVPRGMGLSWRVNATTAGQQVESATASFTGPPVECLTVGGAYAKSVVEWFLPSCSLQHNRNNDPDDTLGPPNAARISSNPFVGTGFMSLGEKGHVTLDMRGCFVDGPGDDLRVYQTVSSEPVTVYVAGSPNGPWISIGDREPCGVRSGGGIFSNNCTFDLATGEVAEARYVRVEDGELYPCEQGTTDSEGADLDAVEMLNRK
jgi:hypothetical protein